MPTTIEWADETWGPTLGCMKVSAGCENCYAIRTAYRQEYGFKRPQYSGLTRRLPDGSVNWTGTVRTLPERLALPLSWRQPRRIFVDSMSDLFHEDVPDEFIAQVFAVMALADRHTFQVLTKRPERMARLVGTGRFVDMVLDAAEPFWDAHMEDREILRWNPWIIEHWPLSNIWLGVSVEDQRAADERIPLLLQTVAAVRFLSCEPLIGPVDLREYLPYYTACGASRDRETQAALDDLFRAAMRKMGGSLISWVIAGGESGTKARLCDPEWVRSLRDQCAAADIAFHFKQWGGRTHAAGGRELDGRTWDEYPDGNR